MDGGQAIDYLRRRLVRHLAVAAEQLASECTGDADASRYRAAAAGFRDLLRKPLADSWSPSVEVAPGESIPLLSLLEELCLEHWRELIGGGSDRQWTEGAKALLRDLVWVIPRDDGRKFERTVSLSRQSLVGSAASTSESR